MLRIILSVTGIAFIALGLFGGKPLDDLYNSVVGPNITIVQDDVSDEIEIQNTQPVEVQAPTVVETSASVASLVAPSDSTVIPAINDAPIKPGVEPTAVKPMPEAIQVSQQAVVNQVTVAQPIGETAPVVTVSDSAVDPDVEAKSVLQVSSVAVDQKKSSDRNKQVALAQTILTTTDSSQPAASVDVSNVVNKEAEITQTLEASAGQNDSETLVVIKDKVNLREGPSIEHPIVMQLAQGQKLMEFKREGRWVHVGAFGTSGKIGWVHQRMIAEGQQ